jgi:hypothetical protein
LELERLVTAANIHESLAGNPLQTTTTLQSDINVKTLSLSNHDESEEKNIFCSKCLASTHGITPLDE